MFVMTQALFVSSAPVFSTAPYNADMKNGKRSLVGERIAQARQTAGLSQVQLAEKLGVTQQMVGYLERQPVAIRPELLLQLREALGISLDELLGQTAKPSRGGPNGKMRQLFEAASKLPRSQQEKILAIIQPFIREHANGNS
jgi:transcriptional regulator with XRE-family HTH domain